MQIFGDYIVEFDIASLVIMTIILWMVIKFKNLPPVVSFFYQGILISGILASLFDVVAVAVLSPQLQLSFVMQNVAQMLYLVPNMMCAVFYFSLSSAITGSFRAHSDVRRYIAFIITAVDTILVVSSPFTHLYFYISDYEYHGNGPMMPVRYAVAFAIMLFAMIDTIRYHKLMTHRQKNLIYSYTASSLAGLIVQFIFPNLLVLNFGIACAALISYFALQNPTDFRDELTGLSNKYGFSHIVNTFFHQGDKFSLVCIEYPELSYVDQVMGSNASHDLIKQLSVQLSELVPKAWLYRISHTRFIIILPHRSERIPSLATDLQKLAETPFKTNGVVFLMKPLICTLHAPESMTYAEDVADAISFGLEQAKKAGNNSCYNVEETAIIRRRRDSAIIHVLNRAIANGEFEVNYQPVFDVAKNCFTRAEALASLNDRALGRISAAEFIPIAESNGIIIGLGETVFDSVCRFVKKNIETNSVLRRISVNLSPIQCLQADLADSIIRIAERYSLSLEHFEFELTSETIEHGGEILFENMSKLTALGACFTVDNYAVNITDAPKITDSPVDTIKISRELILSIISDERMLPAMKNSIAALKELGYKVVATGIEDKDTAEIFKSYGCNYLQGFFYSKPLSEAEFIKLYSN